MPFKRKINPICKERTIKDFPSFVKDNAERFGDSPMYTYFEGKEEVTITYKEFYENTLYFGTAMCSLGFKGKNIAVIGEAHPAYMIAYHEAVWADGVIVPLDKEILDEELADFIKRADIAAVVCMPSQCQRFISLKDKLTDIEKLIFVTKDKDISCENSIFFDDLLSMGKELYDNGDDIFTSIYEADNSEEEAVSEESEESEENGEKTERNIDKPAAIIFSSGTTGNSKGIVLSERNILCAANGAVDALSFLTTGSKLVSVLPMNHTYEITCSHIASQFFGTHTLMNNSLKYVMRNFKKFQPDILVLVPLFVHTMMKKINDELKTQGLEKKVGNAMKISDTALKVGIDLRGKFFGQIVNAFGGNLKAIVSGGAPLGAEAVNFFKSIGVEIIEGYGITECAPLVAVNRLAKIKPGTVGTPIIGCQVRIDKESANDETGEIVVKGDNVMLGYYKDEEATKEVIMPNGEFRTGDIGFIDKQGYIVITGRKKNVIILSNGKNIFPEEIEEYLGKCDLIAESVVVGGDNKLGEKIITAIIYPNYELLEGKSDDDVLVELKNAVDAINLKLPTYKQIRSIKIRKTEFEKTTSKKIKRYKVEK